mgnify:FL=1
MLVSFIHMKFQEALEKSQQYASKKEIHKLFAKFYALKIMEHNKEIHRFFSFLFTSDHKAAMIPAAFCTNMILKLNLEYFSLYQMPLFKKHSLPLITFK